MNQRLGKGLSALMGENDFTLEEINEENVASKKFIEEVSVNDVLPGAFQPRKTFEEEKLRELAESIKINGVISPILVRRISRSSKFQIIAGERRWRASKLAGLKTVPVIITDIEEKHAMETAIIENIQRQDLTIIEEAEGYLRLMDEFGYTQEELSNRLGKSRSHIANMMRILTLPPELKDMINSGKLSMGHAKALVNVDNNVELAKNIAEKGLNVRDTEKMIRNLTKAIKRHDVGSTNNFTSTEDTRLLSESLSESFGLRVVISKSNNGDESGALTFYFNDAQELNSLIEKLYEKHFS